MYRFTLSLMILVLSISLSAQEWERQHPNNPINEMYDVAMHSSGHGMALGTKGVVYVTDDFGDSWEDKSFSIGWSLRQAEVYQDGSDFVYLALSNNTFYKSTDAGDNWTSMSFDVGGPNYLQAFGNVYLAGGRTSLLRSDDGGQNWTDKGPGIMDAEWSSFFFLDAQKGWASNEDGGIYKTTDGGSNWVAQNTTQFDELVSLAFVKENLGYACIRRVLAKTTDGGETWIEMLPEAFGSHVEDIAIIDANRVVFTQGNRTFYTHDGGLSAIRIIPTSYPNTHRGVTAFSDGQVWVAGSYGVVAHSADAGLSYEDQIPGNKNTIAELDFLDPQNGWANGRGASVHRTTNGGDDWEDVSPNNPDWDSADAGLAMSADEYWICGSGYVARTTDSGQSWTPLLEETGSKNDLVQAGDAIMTCDGNGNVLRTTDQGQNWETISIGSEFQRLETFFFYDDMTGYVVGWNAFAAKTTDGGQSWTTMDIPTTDRLDEVFFLTADEGWITSDHFSDTIYHTTNGGLDWEKQAVPNTIWNHIHYTDPMNGYLVGGSSGNGLVYETIDGGQNWEQLYRADQGIIGFDIQITSDAIRMWIGGVGGMIERGTTFILGTRDPVSFESLDIHPNPASTTLQVHLPADLSVDAVLKIYAADGRCVLQQQANAQVSIASLSPGWYQVQVLDAQKIYQASLIKQLD